MNRRDEREIQQLLGPAFERLLEGFEQLPADETTPPGSARIPAVLAEVAERLHDNYPYAHPLYAGQMLKPPHPVARLAYALSMWINPNNHALDGSRASSPMEREAVADLAAMFGWPQHLGHLCSGGTMANLEALWVAGRLRPGKILLASEDAHYTHGRISEVLGIPFEPVPADDLGRMRLDALEAKLEAGHVGTVVATLGTTGYGSVDRLPQILELAGRHGARVHVDAAYGGYFGLSSRLGEEARAAFDRLTDVDSVVIDPHKHGLQPYGCGCVLFRDPAVGRIYRHDSPYTYFTSDDLHLGEISLECSRPGSSAVALWATHRLLPPTHGGEFAAGLDRCLQAAARLHGILAADDRYRTAPAPVLDILIWAPHCNDGERTSIRSQAIFDAAARKDLHLALLKVPAARARAWWPGLEIGDAPVTCLRSVLMKPEHLDWVDRIAALIGEAHDEAEAAS
ncbi:pyridoxal-dependent decarboxylase [Acidobacteria bacterium Mor1]|nr:pyridoxal-dependent decarboxylase [Acidobacteria bacterium Mor1]